MSAITADFLDHWNEAGVSRWFASFALVVALHVCAALIFAFNKVEMLPPVPPDTPVLLDLAPEPAAPPPAAPAKLVAPVPASQGNAAEGSSKAPGQIQVPLTPAPSLPAAPQPKLEVNQLPPPPTGPISEPPQAEPVPVPPVSPSPPAVEVPRFLVPPPPLVVAEAVPRAPAPAASKPAPQAPAGMDVLPQPNAQEDPLSAWQREVLAKLNRLKRGTADNRAGSVDVQFSVDARGHIVYFKIVSKAPFESLNHAVRSLMRRADPLPPPPPGAFNAFGEPQNYTVTIDFVHVPVSESGQAANPP